MAFWQADRRARQARNVRPDVPFTNGTRKAFALAREAAAGMKHDFIGTEHILLGLMSHPENPAVTLVKRLGVDPDQVRARVEECVRPGKATIGNGGAKEFPHTSRAKKSVEYAVDESWRMRHRYVGTEHLLLGLLREEKGIAAEVLNGLGIDLQSARRATLEISGEPQSSETAFRFSIDDTSSESIYEQLVAQVTEAVATGRLNPGDRLPPVRQAADDLDIAPGTVARAYGELERLGVVVTEGARGTRVAQRERSSLPADERSDTLVGLLRPTAVAAFHLGATAEELRTALDQAMQGIF